MTAEFCRPYNCERLGRRQAFRDEIHRLAVDGRIQSTGEPSSGAPILRTKNPRVKTSQRRVRRIVRRTNVCDACASGVARSRRHSLNNGVVAPWSKVPSRALIVTADILEGGAGLCVLMLSFSPTVAVWILFCAVELFTVLSRTGNDYWSSASSPSSASSTSATSG